MGTSGSRGPGNAIGWPDPSYSSLDVTPRISANALFFPFPRAWMGSPPNPHLVVVRAGDVRGTDADAENGHVPLNH